MTWVATFQGWLPWLQATRKSLVAGLRATPFGLHPVYVTASEPVPPRPDGPAVVLCLTQYRPGLAYGERVSGVSALVENTLIVGTFGATLMAEPTFTLAFAVRA